MSTPRVPHERYVRCLLLQYRRVPPVTAALKAADLFVPPAAALTYRLRRLRQLGGTAKWWKAFWRTGQCAGRHQDRLRVYGAQLGIAELWEAMQPDAEPQRAARWAEAVEYLQDFDARIRLQLLLLKGRPVTQVARDLGAITDCDVSPEAVAHFRDAFFDLHRCAPAERKAYFATLPKKWRQVFTHAGSRTYDELRWMCGVRVRLDDARIIEFLQNESYFRYRQLRDLSEAELQRAAAEAQIIRVHANILVETLRTPVAKPMESLAELIQLQLGDPDVVAFAPDTPLALPESTAAAAPKRAKPKKS